MIKRFLVSLVCFTLLFSSFIVEVNANESNEIYQEEMPFLTYQSHVQNIGWQDWVKDGKAAGTVGQAKAIEAVSIRLTGNLQAKYDIYYRVHVQDYGWLDWAKNGANAGTEGLAKMGEAIQIRLIQKGEKAPGSMKESFIKK